MRLYGVQIPDADYEKTKAIAKLLFGLTPSDIPEKEVKQYCVTVAHASIRLIRRYEPKEPKP